MKARRRRAPNPDAATWTAEDRQAIQQSRVNARSARFQRDMATEKSFLNASPRSSTK